MVVLVMILTMSVSLFYSVHSLHISVGMKKNWLFNRNPVLFFPLIPPFLNVSTEKKMKVWVPILNVKVTVWAEILKT